MLALVQGNLKEQMEKWEEYALRFSFSVPGGFSMPKDNEPFGDDLPDLDSLTDSQIDAQLGKNLLSLAKNFRFWRESLTSNQSAKLISEAFSCMRKLMPQNCSKVSKDFEMVAGKAV